MLSHLPALVVLLTVVLQLWMMAAVGFARQRSGIQAPAMSGDPALERAVRVQANTVEQVLIFLPSFGLALMYWGALAASIGGLVWVAGRVLYALSYWKDPRKRGLGFMIGFLASVALLLGGAVGWGLGVVRGL